MLKSFNYYKGSFIEALTSVAAIYLLIIIGYLLKKIFKDDIHEKSFVLLSLYFLQPILVFWGLTREKLNFDFFISPLIYFSAIFLVLIMALFYVRFVFDNSNDKALFLSSALVGNTGNLGIPLGIALFGVSSVPYTSILNIANIFFIFIFSVYFLAGEKFSFLKALKNIFKIPAITVTFFAILFNYFDFTLNMHFDKVFTMAAYTAIVMQLIVFGIFMSQISIKKANWKLSLNIVLFKHIILPLVGLIGLVYFEVEPFLASIIFLELMVPLAINNVNLASLFKRNPIDATFSILLSSIVFVALIYVYLLVINHFFKVS